MTEEEIKSHSLSDICIQVLKSNDHGTHTVPTPGLYPHQWLWDSCFAAIGWAQIDTDRAKQEIYSLLHGQWANGMIPHMIFDMSPKYARDRNVWRSWLARYSPDDVATSGITQPPIIAEAVVRIGMQLTKSQRIAFYKKVLPSLIRYHSWLYNDRDPHHEGLTIQINPYETGLDNTPPWMGQLREHSRPWWIAAIENLKLEKFINVARRDTRAIPPNQRMRNIDALMCWDSVRRLRRKHYDIDKILHRSLFIIEDIAFNSIMVRNNQLLTQIAEEARIKLPDVLINNIELSKVALEDLWDDNFQVYFSRDFISNKLLKSPTIASLLPLYAGTISQERANKLVKLLANDKIFWLKFPIPTVPRNVRGYDPFRYWQGPTWVNTNWLLIDGLSRYGFDKEAASLKSHTLDMMRDSGIWEYYHPTTGEGLGSEDFAWTAALGLDLLNS